MKIFPDVSRIVSAAAIQEDPIRYAPIAVDYEELGAGSIRTRLRPDSNWQNTTVRLQDKTIYWTHVGKEWPWELISEDDLPDWFSAFEAKAQSRMDERATQAKTKKPNKAEMATPRKLSD